MNNVNNTLQMSETKLVRVCGKWKAKEWKHQVEQELQEEAPDPKLSEHFISDHGIGLPTTIDRAQELTIFLTNTQSR